MAFTRIHDDKCSMDGQSKISTGIMNFVLDTTKSVPYTSCMPEIGIYGGITRKMPISQMIDNESKMLGLGQKLSKCPNNSIPCYNPNSKGMYCDGKSQSGVLNTCQFINYKK